MKAKEEGRKVRGSGKKGSLRVRRVLRALAVAGGVGILLLVILFVLISQWPALGARGADWLRGIIGDQAVAGLEMVFCRIQDTLQMWKYDLGLATPGAPWSPLPSPAASLTPVPSASSALPGGSPAASWLTSTPAAGITPQPAFTPTHSVWRPAALAPLGSTEGEGLWEPYIQDAQGELVAYRTFMQPDPERSYALVAIVAIDLTRTRLHYVLGAYEPALPDTPVRSGKMPDADRAANVLLAEFNGGFQGRHGQFGAMADGVLALPPQDGFGTVVMYRNGEVMLGEWGHDDLYLSPGIDSYMSPGIVAFRQNGPLVIQEGEINPRIYNNSRLDWGYAVNDVTATVRSGMGLSRDRRTLYYFCGPSLSMEALAASMRAAGVWNAIQLDINNYWVVFVKIDASDSKLAAEPLLPRLMVADVDRYLRVSTRDFFYITGITNGR
jgi:hypothetical protein